MANHGFSVYGYNSSMLDAVRAASSAPTEKQNMSEGRSELKNDGRCRFLELPQELRYQIYDFTLPSTVQRKGTYQRFDTRYTIDHGIVWLRGNTSLLATNKQISREAMDVFYGRNTFAIDIAWGGPVFDYQYVWHDGNLAAYNIAIGRPRMLPRRGSMAFPEGLAPGNVKLIGHISVRIHHADRYTGMMKYNYGGRGLTDGLTDQVKVFCQALGTCNEIKHLHIEFQNDIGPTVDPETTDSGHSSGESDLQQSSEGSRSSTRGVKTPPCAGDDLTDENNIARTVLKPFFDLRNVYRVTTSGDVPIALALELERRFQDSHA
ncbi:hypothetical protein MMC09_001738 [Bachmanniomyces sp. S44760]|nr:hypothetical protein [Bachmanniomyces sp. S44760]